MDLDDVPEHLADGWAPMAAIVGGLGWLLSLAMTAVVILLVAGGGVGVAAALATGVLALFGIPLASWGFVQQRRQANDHRRRSAG